MLTFAGSFDRPGGVTPVSCITTSL